MTELPKRDNSFIGRTRDHVAWMLAQFAFKYVATPWYRGMIDGSIRLGLKTAAEEELKGKH